jgi:phosphoribosylpyrophosphate synthetase
VKFRFALSKKKKKLPQPSRDRSKPGSIEDASSFAVLLGRQSISKARAALDEGEALKAWQWLQCAAESLRPPDLEAAIQYQLGKDALRREDWQDAESHLAAAIRKQSVPLYQQRLALLRRRKPLLDDHQWETMSASIDLAVRLRRTALAPLVSEVWASGAYYSRGTRSSHSWSQFLRLAKNADAEPEERQAVLRLATGFFCRFILKKTPLLSRTDVVVSIPANPSRYNQRMMSLPDSLARAVEDQLAIPFIFMALTYNAPADLELRGLSWSERHQAVRGSMGAGDLSVGVGRHVLIVDDVMTSGATLSEAARILKGLGALSVHAATMCHTEG